MGQKREIHLGTRTTKNPLWDKNKRYKIRNPQRDNKEKSTQGQELQKIHFGTRTKDIK